ncbi:MAG TPA: serine hydrolase domain-containing protein [Gemmatimonadaceae bacterium]|nr:serine hydrolase domain-containing protein [Gemmatimonadaceae bacterium]
MPVSTTLGFALGPAGSLLLALALVTSASVAQPGSVPHAERLDSMLAAYVAPESPGCGVGMTSGGVTRVSVRGLANVEQRVAASPASRFGIGSVSKQFTGAVIAHLIDDARLGLESPASKFIPELGAVARGITISHLFSHTSGLRDQWHLLWFSGLPFSSSITTADVLRILGRQTTLNFPAGTDWAYSNSNYTLLAVVAERVARAVRTGGGLAGVPSTRDARLSIREGQG